MSFMNKVAIITGASSGIGADAAQHLAKLGASVVLVGRNEQRLSEVSNRIISNKSPNPLVVCADVTKDADKIITNTIDHFGKINILINNAGVMTEENIENIQAETFDKAMDTNVKNAVMLTQKAIPHLEKTKGNILNVSSTAGLTAVPNLLSYCMSKAALDQFTKCIALELAPKRIRVNAICPAAIRTPLYENLGLNTNQQEELFDAYKSRYPIGRIGEVSDTSAAIAYLKGDSASFITGVLFPVDGGALAAGVD